LRLLVKLIVLGRLVVNAMTALMTTFGYLIGTSLQVESRM